ncbi:hypothetical protein HYV10_03395 [Candidatus Dependentiae bacterium]|nr:hypothetical protein [Candidatus Dependentiae bacterium]
MISQNSGLSLRLISLGLLFMIPITINLGIDFFYPAITWQDFNQAEEQFFKKNNPDFNLEKYQKAQFYSPENKQEENEHKNREKQWRNSTEYKELKNKQNQQRKFKYLMILFFMLLLTISLRYIQMPILKCPIIGSITYFLLFELRYINPCCHTPIIQEYFLGIPIEIFEIAISLLSLILITYDAYQDQKA